MTVYNMKWVDIFLHQFGFVGSDKVDNLDHMQLPENLCRIRDKINEGFNLVSWASFILLNIKSPPPPRQIDRRWNLQMRNWKVYLVVILLSPSGLACEYGENTVLKSIW